MTLPVQQVSLPRCANCGVEIPWRPAVHHGKTYCCGGCVQGGPCYCSYDLATLHQPRAWSREAAVSHGQQELSHARNRR